MVKKEFIKLIGDAAVLHYPKYKVLPSLVIAQAILESNWGNSASATKYFNLFGVKGVGTAGTVTMNTEEHEGSKDVTIKAGFRVYNSWAESIEDHSKVLQLSRYKKVLQTVNYKDACVLVKEAGYATDRNYTKLLVDLIEQYKLYLYDDIVIGGEDDMGTPIQVIIDGKSFDGILTKEGRSLVYAADLNAYNKRFDNDTKTLKMVTK